MKADLDDMLAQLQGVRRSGDGYVALCPAHEDKHPSLSVTPADEDQVLVNCHAGCTFEEIAEKLDLPKPEGGREILEAYNYHDTEGNLVYQVVRFWPKEFRQRRPDGGGWIWKLDGTDRLPYRLPKIIKAVEEGRRVFLTEGERDVHSLENLGFVATCNSGGAGKWYPSMTEALQGAHVIILPDNDEAGEKHTQHVNGELTGAKSVEVCRLPDLPPKGDVTDWVRAGGTAEELKKLVTEGGRPQRYTLLDAVKSVGKWRTETMPEGIDYPWGGVNRKTRGLRPGWFCILAGYPSAGKTAAALEVLFTASKRGKRVLLNSLEMNAEEIGIRLTQRWGLDTDRLYRGALTDEDREAMDIAENFPFYSNVELVHERKMSELEAIVADRRPELVVVDYIGIMDMEGDNSYEGTTRLSQSLKSLAREYAVPVLALSQLSRPQDKHKVTPPTMFDLRASGALEADADQIIIVFRDDSQDERESVSEGRFIIAKSRHAKAGQPVKFNFDGRQQIFTEIDEAYQKALKRWGTGGAE